MESSEEDAGVAENTSRRPTAREKDIGTREGHSMENAAGSASVSETTSGSEEVFDNDSVPSPSALDVNTSTEALLDMIDAIVEGPDAPKRLSVPSVNLESVDTYPTASDTVRECPDPITQPPEAEPPPSLLPSSPTLPPQGEIIETEPIIESHTEDVIPSEPAVSNVNRPDMDAVASTSGVSSDPRESPNSQEIVAPTEDIVSSDPPNNIPSSSVTEAEVSVSNLSESVDCARTVKCVTSSDSRDNVTVGSAESTSSESSVSESQSGRSPLRRRLVRPAPLPEQQSSDRRPDCTVSSTADSNIVNVHTTEQTVSECVVKDVTSSSDAVSSVHDYVKPEEIRNVSEVSVCKAETSVSPKKIKLIRQKPPPTLTSKVLLENSNVTQCQSTSSDSQTVLSTPEISENISRELSHELVAEELVQKDTQNLAYIQPEPSPQVETSKIDGTSSEVSDESSNKINENLEDIEPTVSHSTVHNEVNEIVPVSSNEIPSNTSESIQSTSNTENLEPSTVECCSSNVKQNLLDTKQVPKLTIKFSGKQSCEEIKSPLPKVTIKPVKPPEAKGCASSNEQISNLTKLNIKSITKPAEKINDVHRKSSSSEISESESSENDESNSTSDQASASDHGSSDVVPKVTIKLGKPGTDCEGKFYTKPNIPKLTIKGLQNMDSEEQDSSKLTLVCSQTEDNQQEKVPKLTIKAVSKSEGQPLSPKLTIKPVKPPETHSKESLDADSQTVPKITIKSVKTDLETSKTPKKLANTRECDSENDIPVITKLNIKPVVKPVDTTTSKEHLEEKVPVVSKLNIKPIMKPTHSEASQTVDQHVPIVSKINIKPIIKPVDKSASSYCEDSVPVVSKLNIKPVLKPADSLDTSHDSEVKLPVVSKLNIKPIVKPVDAGDSVRPADSIPVISKLNIKPVLKPAGDEDSNELPAKVPFVSKLNIKPILKPKDNEIDSNTEEIHKVTKLNIKPLKNPEAEPSCEKDCDEMNAVYEQNSIPIVTKLNIKPIVKPVDEDTVKESENQSSETGNSSDDNENIPVVTKLNIKPIIKPNESEMQTNPTEENIPVITKLNIKPLAKPEETKSSLSPKREGLRSSDPKHIVKTNESEILPITTEENIPVITKLHIKPLVKPEEASKSPQSPKREDLKSSDTKHIIKPNESETLTMTTEENIPVFTKLNIRPLVKPEETNKSPQSPKREGLKSSVNKHTVKPNESETLISTTDENIPVITKLNIKPVVKPEETTKSPQSPKKEDLNATDLKHIVKSNESETMTNTTDENIPLITKLNIKPLVKPEEHTKSQQSPKREGLRSSDSKNPSVPAVTKLSIKPIITPDETDQPEHLIENDDSVLKNPPLVMKINMKAMTDTSANENDSKADVSTSQEVRCNNISENISISKPECQPLYINTSDNIVVNCKSSSLSPRTVTPKQNCLVDKKESSKSPKTGSTRIERLKIKPICELQSKEQPQCQTKLENISSDTTTAIEHIKHCTSSIVNVSESITMSVSNSPRPSTQNCTLLKKLLESKKDGLDTRLEENIVNTHHIRAESESIAVGTKDFGNSEHSDTKVVYSESNIGDSLEQNKINDLSKQQIDSLTKPLEVIVPEKLMNQSSSGQDSPRIILKINKTDQGASAKIITEDVKKPDSPKPNDASENTQECKEKQVLKKNALNSRKRAVIESPSLTVGKRLRSSRVVEGNTPVAKKNVCKLSPTAEISPPQNKEPELTTLESKRLKLGQLLSNKSLTITPIPAKTQLSPPKPSTESLQGSKIINHTIMNNENCSKNGSSKLQTILSNLQVKQALALNDVERERKTKTDLESNASTGSLDVVEVIPMETSLVGRDNGESRDVNVIGEEARDPLDTSRDSPAPPTSTTITPASDATITPTSAATITPTSAAPVTPPPGAPVTPQPKKRGRPRKIPVSEDSKPPAPVVLPTPALEERPQRSLRLNRERPAILVKPRGRGRGRGARRDLGTPRPPETPTPQPEPESPAPTSQASDEDPTSSRIKLPRLTEALDRMPASLVDTPVSRRRRSSTPMRLLSEGPELKVVLENTPIPQETSGRGGRPLRGRGSRGGKMYTPRNRGRGRGGGRGAVYMKETMGIYGRVCGPATTTVQLFEEETCMMDDNATPAKPSNLIDEDSQSSVKSLTNESTVKKSKLDDLFDSKEWTAADVKEYIWPPPDKQQPNEPPVTYMIQEQIALFLGVRSFGRRYPELKGRSVTDEERDYILSKGIVDDALCQVGITAVDASNVLDIMLSDFPHKYEEFRCDQRARQLAEAEAEASMEVEESETKDKPEPKVEAKVEMKVEPKVETKPEPSKADLEKTRLELAQAAIASASEWNARLNVSRRVGSADLQSLTVQVRRGPPPAPPAPRVQPPAGFYPHALLPGQYQHSYRVYTPEQLRYFPLNTVIAAPPVPPSPPPSEDDSDSDTTSSDDSLPPVHPAKRKKLTKTKRSSQNDTNAKDDSGPSTSGAAESSQPVELCRVCNLRQEGNRKHSHERFLACATCNAKFHPNCVTLGADTVRRARQYAWQCAACKQCARCGGAPPHLAALLCCHLCDRGFHTHCLGFTHNPPGRWHCAECAVCKSCGARDPAGPPDAAPATLAGAAGGPPAQPQWTHHTKRGPGGHKVYSHSLCTPCARAHRIGRYCPLCDRSIIAPKGSMQLIICKLCDRQHHQECVRGSTTSVVKVLDWTCAECRRGGITSRSAAARAAPRTIATLFMAKRRFNKYAHRQFLQARRPPAAPAPPDASDNSTLDPLNDASDSLAETPELVDASDSILDPSDSIVDPSDSTMEPTDPLHDVSESDPLVEASESDPLVDPVVEAAAEAEVESREPPEDPLQGAEDEAAAAVAALAMHMA